MSDCAHEWAPDRRVCTVCGWTMEEVEEGHRIDYAARHEEARRRTHRVRKHPPKPRLVTVDGEAILDVFLAGAYWAGL